MNIIMITQITYGWEREGNLLIFILRLEKRRRIDGGGGREKK